jgi:hypothetical protein
VIGERLISKRTFGCFHYQKMNGLVEKVPLLKDRVLTISHYTIYLCANPSRGVGFAATFSKVSALELRDHRVIECVF